MSTGPLTPPASRIAIRERSVCTTTLPGAARPARRSAAPAHPDRSPPGSPWAPPTDDTAAFEQCLLRGPALEECRAPARRRQRPQLLLLLIAHHVGDQIGAGGALGGRLHVDAERTHARNATSTQSPEWLRLKWNHRLIRSRGCLQPQLAVRIGHQADRGRRAPEVPRQQRSCGRPPSAKRSRSTSRTNRLPRWHSVSVSKWLNSLICAALAATGMRHTCTALPHSAKRSLLGRAVCGAIDGIGKRAVVFEHYVHVGYTRAAARIRYRDGARRCERPIMGERGPMRITNGVHHVTRGASGDWLERVMAGLAPSRVPVVIAALRDRAGNRQRRADRVDLRRIRSG